MIALKLVISSDTFLKSRPENPDLLGEAEKLPVFVGDWVEVETGCEYPLGHYQVKFDNAVWYVFKRNAFLED